MTTSPIQTQPRHSFAEYSHPEAEERPSGQTVQPQNLREDLARYKETEDLSNDDLGRMLGYIEGTPVSKYLNGKWDRTQQALVEFEARATDMLRTQRLRQRYHIDTLRTSVVRQVENVLDSIRQTGTVGVIHGEAGLGKTTGVASYREKNPSTLFVTANRCQNDERGILRLLVSAVGKHRYKQGQSYWEFLINTCQGTDLLVVIDHAQRLSKAAIDTVFDFHDQTGCPIAFVGNPAILHRIATDDNNHSRALKEYPVKLDRLPEIVRHIISHFTDDVSEVEDLAMQVVKRSGKGRLRALGNLLRSAVDFSRDPDLPGGFRGAFQVAMSESIQHKA